MLTTHPSSVVQKRDLHVGGLGSSATGALAAVIDPLQDAADSWLEKVRDAAQEADDFLRRNPLASLAIAALAGLAVGYLLSRRS